MIGGWGVGREEGWAAVSVRAASARWRLATCHSLELPAQGNNDSVSVSTNLECGFGTSEFVLAIHSLTVGPSSREHAPLGHSTLVATKSLQDLSVEVGV